MPISTTEFWKLAIDSQVLDAAHCRQLQAEFQPRWGDTAVDPRQAPGASVKRLADLRKNQLERDELLELVNWLVKKGVLTRYQAKILAAGRAGPFVFGDYVVVDRHAAEPLAGVFRARHLGTRHRVSLVFLTPRTLADAEALARLGACTELARKASNDQPILTRSYEHVVWGTYQFIVAEDIGGAAGLPSKVAGKARLELACHLARQVALALSSLHGQGGIHGEVRPSSVRYDEPEGVKLLQFPLAGSDAPRAQSRSERHLAGAAYAAPEIAQGSHPTPRSDLYALGCTLYEWLCGEPPFVGENPREVLVRQVSDSPLPLAQRDQSIPDGLSRLVGYLLDKNPDLRFQQAARLAESLVPFCGSRAVPTALPTPDPRCLAFETWHNHRRAGTRPDLTPANSTPTQIVTGIEQNLRQSPAAGVQVDPIAVTPQVVAYATPPPSMAAVPAPNPAPARPTVQASDSQPAMWIAPTSETQPRKPTATARPRQKVDWAIGAAAGCLALVVLLVVFRRERDAAVTPAQPTASTTDVNDQSSTDAITDATTIADATDSPLDTETASTPTASPTKENFRALDEPLWDPPYTGEPIPLAYVPAGSRLIIAIRPSDIVHHREGERLLDPRVTGPPATWLIESVLAACDLQPAQVEQVIIGVLPTEGAAPEFAFVIRLLAKAPREALLAKWKQAPPRKVGQETVFTRGSQALFLPTAGGDKLVVMAPANEIEGLVTAGAGAPPLRREVELLWKASCRDHELSILGSAESLLMSGEGWLTGPAAGLRDPLAKFLELADAEAQPAPPRAILLSIGLGNDLFVELRVHQSFRGRSAAFVAREYKDRIGRLSKAVADQLWDLSVSPYSKPILRDFPAMLQALDRYARAGYDDEQIVIRSYLPVGAAHHLALATHLALLESQGGGTPDSGAVSTGETSPQTVAQRLQQKTSLKFPGESLESSVKILADDVGVAIELSIKDLEVAGIPKQAPFAFDERDQPAGQILRKLLLQRRPDGTLIYVIRQRPGTNDEEVLITTRQAAGKRGDKLPAEFEEAP